MHYCWCMNRHETVFVTRNHTIVSRDQSCYIFKSNFYNDVMKYFAILDIRTKINDSKPFHMKSSFFKHCVIIFFQYSEPLLHCSLIFILSLLCTFNRFLSYTFHYPYIPLFFLAHLFGNLILLSILILMFTLSRSFIFSPF